MGTTKFIVRTSVVEGATMFRSKMIVASPKIGMVTTMT
jgi:hypothetical protein